MEYEQEYRSRQQQQRDQAQQQKLQQQQQNAVRDNPDKSSDLERSENADVGQPVDRSVNSQSGDSQNSAIKRYEEAQKQQQQQEEEPLLDQPPQIELGPSVQERMKEYEEQLMVEVQGVSEDTQFNLTHLDKLAYLCGSNMQLWFHILVAEVYFKLLKLEEDVKFNHLIDFAAFNQFIIENGIHTFIRQFVGNQQLTPAQFINNYFNDSFIPHHQVQAILTELNYRTTNTTIINTEDFQNLIVDLISQLPL